MYLFFSPLLHLLSTASHFSFHSPLPIPFFHTSFPPSLPCCPYFSLCLPTYLPPSVIYSFLAFPPSLPPSLPPLLSIFLPLSPHLPSSFSHLFLPCIPSPLMNVLPTFLLIFLRSNFQPIYSSERHFPPFLFHPFMHVCLPSTSHLFSITQSANLTYASSTILAPLIVIKASITPENYTVQYNSTFKTETILQGLPVYNIDFQIVDWRTGKASSIEGLTFVDSRDGYLKLTAQYNSFECSHTGVHRTVLELEDYSQFQYELSRPLLISGKTITKTSSNFNRPS